MPLKLPATTGVANHYRVAHRHSPLAADVPDAQLLGDLWPLRSALRRRYGEDVTELLGRLGGLHPEADEEGSGDFHGSDLR